MKENPFKGPDSRSSRPEPKGVLLVAFVTISAALAALTGINATLFVLVAFFRAGSTVFGMERLTSNIAGALLFSTASWAGWNRRWPLAIAAFAGGFLVRSLIVGAWSAFH